MLGIVILLALSWLLLHFIENKNLLALGLMPPAKRIRQFTVSFILTALLCFLAQYLEAFFKDSSWVINEKMTTKALFQSAYWDIKSVLSEELVFRGALLYLLIHKMGRKKSILLSAAAFGVYHWFSYGVIGNLIPMLLVFLGTGLMGYAWALAFAKSKTMVIPFGLHLGWNVVYNTVFSKGPLGETLLVSEGGQALSDWISLLNFSIGLIGVPMLVLAYVAYFVKTEEEFSTP